MQCFLSYEPRHQRRRHTRPLGGSADSLLQHETGKVRAW